MTLDDGIIALYTVGATNTDGQMPVFGLTLDSRHYFAQRTVGMARQYAAKGVMEQIDMLVRIWDYPGARIGMHARIECAPYDGEEYRIDNVQRVEEDGLYYTDLTLRRLEGNYNAPYNQ